MEIKQFRYSRDNLGYLVYAQGRGIAVDGGDPDAIAEFAGSQGIEILWVTNTHSHRDHTSGNAGLMEKTGAGFLDCRSMTDGQIISLGQEGLEVMLTPGHTDDSVCFRGPGFLVTGDTLFNATVGNCFSGDLDAFFLSLKRLMALPGETRIYAGHDYVAEALAEARSIEGNHPDLDAYAKAYEPTLVVSTLSEELKVNPYIRFNAPQLVQKMKSCGVTCDTERQRFVELMENF